ncbi:hypothetical protein LTR84_011997 [Exophiala bonariae]|uniref:NB-ARC domain-containing protein n=1 Tax=Exophiala bonariae TaxID=1690606 RepID=A0AAV9MU73_9EURO|nr:hypothetical protein LTR84_011997 [Exophiala bonariae]
MTLSERANALIAWLGDEESRPPLFLIDDLDALKSMSNLTSILPSTAQTIIYTGRDPYMFVDPPGDIAMFSIDKMDLDETVEIMQRVLKSLPPGSRLPTISEQALKQTATLLDGHPLAAYTNNPDWESRLAFIDFKPRPGRSIREVFEVSLNRLEHGSPVASQLLHIAAFLSGSGLDFIKFLRLDRPWISKLEAGLPQVELFTTKTAARRVFLNQLESTSSFTCNATDGTLMIPQLWLECLRQRVRHPGRIRILRQLCLLAKASIFLQKNGDVVRPYLGNCMEIARSFRISEAEINYSDDDICQLLQDHQVPITLTTVLQQCQMIETNFSQEPGFATDEAFNKYVSQITPLLRQFMDFERLHDWATSSRVTVTLHIEVYDIFIRIIRGNAGLSLRLQQQRKAFMAKHRIGG